MRNKRNWRKTAENPENISNWDVGSHYLWSIHKQKPTGNCSYRNSHCTPIRTMWIYLKRSSVGNCKNLRFPTIVGKKIIKSQFCFCFNRIYNLQMSCANNISWYNQWKYNWNLTSNRTEVFSELLDELQSAGEESTTIVSLYKSVNTWRPDVSSQANATGGKQRSLQSSVIRRKK